MTEEEFQCSPGYEPERRISHDPASDEDLYEAEILGKIINISSVSGIVGNAGQANYSASKAGLIGLTKSVARELASRNICVNAVAPGFIRTDMTDKLPEAVQDNAVGQIPLKKMGRPEDVAQAVLFLAGNTSDYITGQVLCVDGGMAM